MAYVSKYFCYNVLNKQIVDTMHDAGWDYELIKKYDTYLVKKNRVQRTGRTAYRDSTRTKVYRAEWDFEKKTEIKKFSSQKDAEKYLKKVLKSKCWEKLGGRSDVKLNIMRERTHVRTSGRAHSNGTIDLCPTTGMNEYTLLHELSHIAGNMHHDVSFRTTLVSLVSRFMGRDTGKLLKKTFRDAGLKMSVSTSFKLPEDWLKSYNRAQVALISKNSKKSV